MKTVFITGASSGLGSGLAEHYASLGAWVGLLARRETRLAEVAERVQKVGGRAAIYVADVSDLSETTRAIESFCKMTGGVDLVIANAGRGESVTTTRFDPQSARDLLTVNVLGLSNTLLPIVPHMLERRRGTLVGMSSVAGYRALPGSLAYSASKAAVMTFMEGLSLELAGSGVHAMSICPGFVRTPLSDLNDFAMPFLIECDEACRRIAHAIESKRHRYTFPKRMAALTPLLRFGPHALLHAVSPKSPLKKRRN